MNVQFSSQGLLCTLVSCLLLQHSAVHSSERESGSTQLRAQNQPPRSYSAQLETSRSTVGSYWLNLYDSPKKAAQAFIDWTYSMHMRRSTQQEREIELKAFLEEAQKRDVLTQIVRPMLPISEVRATLHQIHPAIVERQALTAMKLSFASQEFHDVHTLLSQPDQIQLEHIGTIANLSDRILRETPLGKAILHTDLEFALDSIKWTESQKFQFPNSSTHGMRACNTFIFFATALYAIAHVKPDTIPKYRTEEPCSILLENLISITQALESRLIDLLPLLGRYNEVTYTLLDVFATKLLREQIFENAVNNKFTCLLRALVLKIYSHLNAHNNRAIASFGLTLDKQQNKTNISSFLGDRRIEQIALQGTRDCLPAFGSIKTAWRRLTICYQSLLSRQRDRLLTAQELMTTVRQLEQALGQDSAHCQDILKEYCSDFFTISELIEALNLNAMQRSYVESKRAFSVKLETQLNAMQPNTASGSRDIHSVIMAFLHGKKQAKQYQST